MKESLKNIFSGSYIESLLVKLVRYLFKKGLDDNFNAMALLREHSNQLSHKLYKEKIKSIGKGVAFNGTITITHPEFVSIGNNVHIGDNAFFNSLGSLTICSHTHISRNVTIYTQNHNYSGEALPYDDSYILKPVFIGESVWIGMNVSIVPGITIGEGAIIGMGTVVNHDVEPFAVIGSPPITVIKNRNKNHYQKLKKNKAFGGVNGKKLSNNFLKRSKVSGIEKEENMVFVVSTGRAGSQTIASVLNQNPLIHGIHEPHGQLISLSTQYAYRTKERQEVASALRELYISCHTYPSKGVYVESDQKLSNLIELLSEILPKSKFIWLIRRADDFVVSSYSRGWYRDDELALSRGQVHSQWINNRLEGNKICVLSENEWASMPPFEKNCWYWSYWNELIEKQLDCLSPDRHIKIKLEEFDTSLPLISDFLNIEEYPYSIHQFNQADYKKVLRDSWDENMKSSYKKWCACNMNRWYNSTLNKISLP